MGDNKENSSEKKPDGDSPVGYEAEGVLGSVGTASESSPIVTLAQTTKKKRKAKSAKASSDSGNGASMRRSSSARTSRRGSFRNRNITSQYSQKKLNKRKRNSNGTASEVHEDDANKYKRDFDDAIAKLTNPNLLTKAKTGEGNETSSNNSSISQEGVKRAGVGRRVRSAQSVVGPRPHGLGVGESSTRPVLTKQTLSVDTSPLPVLVRENGIGISKPFGDKQRPLTASSVISSKPSTIHQDPKPVIPRPRSEHSTMRTAPQTGVIQSRLRTYFSGAPVAGTRSMVASTLKASPAVSEDTPVVNGTGPNTGSQSTSANSGTSSAAHPGPVKLKTTTSTITLKPINGLSLISPSSESLSSACGSGSLHGIKGGSFVNSNPTSSTKTSCAKPKPILKSADVSKAKHKRNVRFALPEDDSDD